MNMDEAREALREAKIFRLGTDPAQREKSNRMLRQIVDEADGSPQAREALELLSFDPSASVSVRDPELEELFRKWSGIQGLTDHRLPDFLKRLEFYHGVAVPLRTEVVKSLRKWLSNALDQVTERAEDRAALNDFIAVASGVSAYEEIPEFVQLYDLLFHFRLQDIIKHVDETLKDWRFDEARKMLDDLGLVPDGFKTEIKRLDEEIDDVDHLRKAVKELLCHFPGQPPANWTEVRLSADLLQRVHEYVADARIPPGTQRELGEARDHWKSTIQTFVRNQALIAVTLEGLRSFWVQFSSLPLDGAGWNADESWFQPGLAAIFTSLNRDVERALNPDDLTAAISRLRFDAHGLPLSVVARIEELTGEISRLAAVWRTMLRGEPFELQVNENGDLKMPATFCQETEKYNGWLAKVEGELAFCKSENIQSEQVYQDGLKVAEEVLAQSPNHALAEKLQVEARRRLANYRLDQALAHWDIEGFARLVESHAPGEIYLGLIAGKKELLALANLAHKATFSTWTEAAQWWADWRSEKKRLTVSKPDSLRRIILQQEDQRQNAWYEVLEALLKDELSPQEYQAAAASLENDRNDPHIETYQHGLLRKAIIGRVIQAIKSKEFEQAEDELLNLSPGTDAVRLGTQLKVERARVIGGSATAEVIYNEWQNVRSHVERPHVILLETIRKVWEEDHQEWLEKLKRVLSQELFANFKGADPAVAEVLTEWEVWFGIEQAILSKRSAFNVKRLADYLRNADPGELLSLRLKRLVSHWQNQNNTVMLAWSYQAFQRKDATIVPPFDPAADLVAESDGLAEQVLARMATDDRIARTQLESLRESLKQEESNWRDLDDFLSFLPHTVVHRQPSPKFQRAKVNVENLMKALADLAQLQKADLRQESQQELFEETRTLVNRLVGIALQEKLKKELDRSEPLQGVHYFELQIQKAAEICGSEDPIRIQEPGHFGALADLVNQIVERFDGAESEGSEMWRIVSSDCWSLVYREACILRPASNPPDLRRLVALLKELHNEEVRFSAAIDALEDRDRQPKVPKGGEFDPQRHKDYLGLIPGVQPGSRKTYFRFDRCARQHPMPTILNDARQFLPDWVRRYLDKGVPECENTH